MSTWQEHLSQANGARLRCSAERKAAKALPQERGALLLALLVRECPTWFGAQRVGKLHQWLAGCGDAYWRPVVRRAQLQHRAHHRVDQLTAGQRERLANEVADRYASLCTRSQGG